MSLSVMMRVDSLYIDKLNVIYSDKKSINNAIISSISVLLQNFPKIINHTIAIEALKR